MMDPLFEIVIFAFIFCGVGARSGILTFYHASRRAHVGNGAIAVIMFILASFSDQISSFNLLIWFLSLITGYALAYVAYRFWYD